MGLPVAILAEWGDAHGAGGGIPRDCGHSVVESVPLVRPVMKLSPVANAPFRVVVGAGAGASSDSESLTLVLRHYRTAGSRPSGLRARIV